MLNVCKVNQTIYIVHSICERRISFAWVDLYELCTLWDKRMPYWALNAAARRSLYPEPRQHTLDLRYLCQMSGGEMRKLGGCADAVYMCTKQATTVHPVKPGSIEKFGLCVGVCVYV